MLAITLRCHASVALHSPVQLPPIHITLDGDFSFGRWSPGTAVKEGVGAKNVYEVFLPRARTDDGSASGIAPCIGTEEIESISRSA